MKGARLPFVLAAAVAAALSASAPVFAGPPYGMKSESYVVPTRHGDLYVEVVRPVDTSANTVRGPAIFTLSPYSILGRNGDASRWVPRGYARVWADVVGTGNSGGCYGTRGTAGAVLRRRDAFSAGLIAGLLARWHAERTCAFASVVGASATTALGCTARVFSRGQAESFLQA